MKTSLIQFACVLLANSKGQEDIAKKFLLHVICKLIEFIAQQMFDNVPYWLRRVLNAAMKKIYVQSRLAYEELVYTV